MAVRNVDLKCSGCGAALAPAQHFCEYCNNAVVITSFNSISELAAPDLQRLTRALDKDLAGAADGDPALRAQAKFTQAACWLKLKLYDKAQQRFEEAIEENFDNPEAYFYAAVCLLKGKKAFLAQRADIDRALEFINSALLVEERGVFHYFLAYIKQDFFARKCLKISPDYLGELALARQHHLSPADAVQLFDLLGVACPSMLDLALLPR